MHYNPENPIHQAFETIGQIVILNLCFILTCIPIITIGPSINAIFYALFKRKDESYEPMIQLYFSGFKTNFFQNLLLGIFFLIYLYASMITISLNKLNAMTFLGIFVGMLYFLYLFSYHAIFNDTLSTTLKNAFLFSITTLPTNLFLTALTLLFASAPFLFLDLAPLTAFCLFFFGFGLLFYILVHCLYKHYEPYLNEKM